MLAALLTCVSLSPPSSAIGILVTSTTFHNSDRFHPLPCLPSSRHVSPRLSSLVAAGCLWKEVFCMHLLDPLQLLSWYFFFRVQSVFMKTSVIMETPLYDQLATRNTFNPHYTLEMNIFTLQGLIA